MSHKKNNKKTNRKKFTNQCLGRILNPLVTGINL